MKPTRFSSPATAAWEIFHWKPREPGTESVVLISLLHTSRTAALKGRSYIPNWQADTTLSIEQHLLQWLQSGVKALMAVSIAAQLLRLQKPFCSLLLYKGRNVYIFICLFSTEKWLVCNEDFKIALGTNFVLFSNLEYIRDTSILTFSLLWTS